MRSATGLVIFAALLMVWGHPATGARVIPLSEGVQVAEPVFDVLSSSGEVLTLRFDLPGLEVEEFRIEDRVFSLVSVSGGNHEGEIGRPAVPFITRLISTPPGAGVRVEMIEAASERLEGIDLLPVQPDPEENVDGFILDEAYYSAEPLEETPWVTVGDPAVLRDLRVVPVTFRPVRYSPAGHALEVLRSLTVRIEFAGEDPRNVKKSVSDLIPTSFDRMYRSLVLNYDGPGAGQRVGNGSYLVISPDIPSVVNDLQPLLEWRTRMGYPSVLVTTTDIGGSGEMNIEAFIQTAYDTWEVPPEYVCLVGDATVSDIMLPTFHDPYYGVEGDHRYVLVEGTDILADIHIGRISIATTDKIPYAVDKIIRYETDPYMAETHWFKAASLIGDPTSSGITTVHVAQWIKQRLLELGYTHIDEWYANNANTFFANSLNAGVGIFAYRGFYGMSGIDNSDIAALTNGEMIPFAVELTCGVGSFEQETSRSEKFFRLGDLGDMKGAIGSIATAGINTHTRYNNVMMMGIMNGLLYADLPELGACLAEGKLAMYLNFYENDAAEAEAYAYWNNLIGDPATRCWTEVPAPVPSVTFPSGVPTGTTLVPVTVEDPAAKSPIEAACVCLWKDGETHVSGFTDGNGHVDLPVNTPGAGPMKITVTRWNMRPFLGDIAVSQAADHVALGGFTVDDDTAGSSSGDGDGVANPGEGLEVSLELENTGTRTAHNVSATMTSADPFVTVIDDAETYGDIAPGATLWDPDDFDIAVHAACPHGHEIPLDLHIQSDEGAWDARLMLPVTSVEFAYSAHAWIGVGTELDPGESGLVSIAVTNTGGMDGAGVTGQLVSLSQYLDVTKPAGSYGAISQGATVSNAADPFGISASVAAFPGHVAPCFLVLEAGSGARDTVTVFLRIGTAASTDPVGPDGYGYYAFDNTDAGYLELPTYEWVEIAGNYGGPGTDVGLNDNGFEQDSHVVVDLPFPFVYYGQTFTRVTICSNGWMAMGNQNINECWNMTIPHPAGPNAMIAPFWDDLYQPSGSEVWRYYDAAGHRFIVEWSRLRNQNAGATEVFEVILLDPEHHPTATGDGEILFQYHTVTNSNCTEWQCQPYATVGIENPDHTDGLLYSFWNQYPAGAAPLVAGRAIRFVPYTMRDSGYITGAVTNGSAGGLPITGAEVRLLGSGRSLFTAGNGVFFGSAPVDTCDVVATCTGFAPDTAYAVEITKDDTTVVNFSLMDIAGPGISGTTRYPLTGDTLGPYPIETRILDGSGIEETILYYRVDLGPFQALPLADLGEDDYRAEIPGQALGSRVDYYVQAEDLLGFLSRDPQGAPGDTTFVFHVAPITTILDDDFESPGGWSVSGTASTGQWQQADPNATWYGAEMVQPEDDHTPSPGVVCYVTGQSVAGAGQGDNDVDGGYTRLVSPVLDLSDYSSVILSYYRWYTNDTGNAPGEDFWQVEVNDGGGWEALEYTNESARSWEYSEFDLVDYVDLTDQVQVRFVAEDGGSGSIVEAGVDDVLLTGFSVPQDTQAPSVTLLDPNGGELLQGGLSCAIRWSAADDMGIASTKILLSTDGGLTYPDTIANGVYDSTFLWMVPNVDEPSCRIQVVCLDGASNEARDASDGSFQIGSGTGITLADLRGPVEVALEQNRPNPFNPVTEIRFGLPRPMPVTLRVYGVEGRLVRTLADGFHGAGYHSAVWSGEDEAGVEVSSGVYFYRLETPDRVITRKMIMLK